MGLVDERLVGKGQYSAAVYTSKHIAVATPHSIAGYSIRDGVLEYEIATPGAVSSLVWSRDRGMLAVIANGRCYLQSVKDRRKTFDFGTTSANSVAAAGQYIVVASKRRLRYLVPGPVFENSLRELSLAVSMLDLSATGKALCVVKNNQVAIVDLTAQRVLQVPLTLPEPPIKVACFESSGLVISGKRGYFLTMSGKVVAVIDWKDTPLDIAPIDDGVFGVLVNGKLEARNPLTGYLLAQIDCNGSSLAKNLVVGSEIIGVRFHITAEDVLSLDITEAVPLVDQLPEIAADPRIRILRTEYADTLVDEGEISRALKLYTVAETPVQQVVAKLRPIIESIPTEESNDMSSVFSNRTSRTTNSNPTVESTVRYLVQARRKLFILAAAEERPVNAEDATAVDTMLFLCYIKIHSPLVGPLVRVDNFCDVETVRSTLLSIGKWKELATFLSGKGLHVEALELLRDKANDPQIIDYLVRFAADDYDLTTKFSRGPISRSPQLAITLFANSKLNKVKLNDFLADINESLAWELLERWIRDGDQTSELHTRWAIKLVKDESPETEMFLRQSKIYDAKKVLKNVTDPLLQAILYGRLKKHDKAIELYITAREYDLCEVYCDEIYKDSKEEGIKAVQTLYNVLLETNTTDRLISLLNTQGTRLDFSETLEKLPKDLPCDSIVPFLMLATRRLSHNVKTSQMEVAASKVYLGEQAFAAVKAAQVSATVTSTTTCSVCHKRVGKSVIGLTDHGVVHYGCL
ncbi:Vacuolar morphogenesis protein 6 [Wickerhamiella sorbophila]|uniref:Vacuolar morphogenesis protein 6 n=1 Tax=Wickerhamiella sorbophila TaxID=45607 RepID=A0A2T0FHD4_9ASCO|nr:Vacuolar morphogenesis protein 6 [Wickerhamiella sorbophila]PRT54401.1 Vacuolar morphogenesis protein 6 [Wickerhamiella sorbophila]